MFADFFKSFYLYFGITSFNRYCFRFKHSYNLVDKNDTSVTKGEIFLKL